MKKKKDKKTKKQKRSRRRSSDADADADADADDDDGDVDDASKRPKLEDDAEAEKKASEIWRAPVQIEEEKSREDDFSEYLEDLFL